LVFDGGRLVGAILVGDVAHGGVLTWLIRSQLPVMCDRQLLLKGDPLELEASRQLIAAGENSDWSREATPELPVR